MMQNKGQTPCIRFSGYGDSWEQQKLGKLAQFSKGTGYSKSVVL